MPEEYWLISKERAREIEQQLVFCAEHRAAPQSVQDAAIAARTLLRTSVRWTEAVPVDEVQHDSRIA